MEIKNKMIHNIGKQVFLEHIMKKVGMENVTLTRHSEDGMGRRKQRVVY